jgi:hypothetical protein
MKQNKINYFEQSFKKVKDQLNEISPTMCLAKWKQTTLNLHTGSHASCCLANSAKIPKDQLKTNPSVLHNTQMDKDERKLMLDGNYPLSCKYCWKQESLNQDDTFSERVNKSKPEWAQAGLDDIKDRDHSKMVTPSYLEVSFSNNCNFKCIYCYSHTSSTLNAEIKKHGPYPDRTQVGTTYVEDLYNGAVENPYSDAFWEWMPEIYQDLQTLRVTGGEPLLDPNLFKIFDYIINNPNPNLELSINTNLGVDTKIIERMITNIKKIPRENYKNIVMVSSLDCGGKEVEYIRYGLKTELFKVNMNKILTDLPGVTVRITSTITLLAVATLDELLDYVMTLKRSYPESEILLTPYPIINPSFLSLSNMNTHLKRFVYDAQVKMQSLLENNLDYTGFNDYELKSFSKIVENMEGEKDENDLLNDKADFYFFIAEYDRRKGTDFKQTFPEHQSYMASCENSAQELEQELRNSFESDEIILMINSVKNLMRLHNVNIEKLFPQSLKSFFTQDVLDEFFRVILSISSKEPYFDISKFSETAQVTSLSKRAWIKLFSLVEYKTLQRQHFNPELLENFYLSILEMARDQDIDTQNSLFIVYFLENANGSSIIESYLNTSTTTNKYNNEFEYNLFLFYVKNFLLTKKVGPSSCFKLLPSFLPSQSRHSKFLDLSLLLGINTDIDNYFTSHFLVHLEKNPFEELVSSALVDKLDVSNDVDFKVQWFNIVFKSFSRFPYHEHLVRLFEKFGQLEPYQYREIHKVFLAYMQEKPYDNNILDSLKMLQNVDGESTSLFIENWQTNFRKDQSANSRYWEVLSILSNKDIQCFEEILNEFQNDIYNQSLRENFTENLNQIPAQKISTFLHSFYSNEDCSPQLYFEIMELIRKNSTILPDTFSNLINTLFEKNIYNTRHLNYWGDCLSHSPSEISLRIYQSMLSRYKDIDPEIFNTIMNFFFKNSTISNDALYSTFSSFFIADMYNDTLYDVWSLLIQHSPNSFTDSFFRDFIEKHKYVDSNRFSSIVDSIEENTKFGKSTLYSHLSCVLFLDIYNDIILNLLISKASEIPQDIAQQISKQIEASSSPDSNDRLLYVIDKLSKENGHFLHLKETIISNHFYENPYSPHHIKLFKKVLKEVKSKERQQFLVDSYFQRSVNHTEFDDAHWGLYIELLKKHKLSSKVSLPFISSIIVHDKRKHVLKAELLIQKLSKF